VIASAAAATGQISLRVHHSLAETAIGPLLTQDIPLDDLSSRFIARLRKELDDGHVGFSNTMTTYSLKT